MACKEQSGNNGNILMMLDTVRAESIRYSGDHQRAGVMGGGWWVVGGGWLASVGWW